jgi:hypothetical protein
MPVRPCSAAGAFSLDYSQSLFKGKTSHDHIMQRHGGSGLPGVSQYFGDFSEIKNINSMTYLFGAQVAQGNSVVFQYTFPQLLSPFAVTHIGTDPSGNHYIYKSAGNSGKLPDRHHSLSDPRSRSVRTSICK